MSGGKAATGRRTPNGEGTDGSWDLLNWWFNTPNLLPRADGTMAEFKYYFAQREALRTTTRIFWLRFQTGESSSLKPKGGKTLTCRSR
ncbi:MAG: hypothetical protein ACREDR_18145 [Blastocatellia bacterium]